METDWGFQSWVCIRLGSVPCLLTMTIHLAHVYLPSSLFKLKVFHLCKTQLVKRVNPCFRNRLSVDTALSPTAMCQDGRDPTWRHVLGLALRKPVSNGAVIISGSLSIILVISTLNLLFRGWLSPNAARSTCKWGSQQGKRLLVSYLTEYQLAADTHHLRALGSRVSGKRDYFI